MNSERLLITALFSENSLQQKLRKMIAQINTSIFPRGEQLPKEWFTGNAFQLSDDDVTHEKVSFKNRLEITVAGHLYISKSIDKTKRFKFHKIL